MSRFSCVLIGNEVLLRHCAQALVARGHRIAAIATASPEIGAWAAERGIETLAPGPGIEARIAAAVPGGFDWLFSIGNLTLLPESLIAQARGGAINFHDAPLPRLGGLNAPVWALLEGATRHGITWHMIVPETDAGDIVEQVEFDIAPDETAFSLNARCLQAGIESFARVIAAIEAGDPPRRKQDVTQLRLCRRDDRPAAAGMLDFRQDAGALARLVRALDHGGYWNPLCLPKIAGARGVFAVGKAEPAAGSGAPGEVLESGEELVVACDGGAVRLEALTCQGGVPVRGSDIAGIGEFLAAPDTARLEAALARVVAGERHWRAMLAGFRPAQVAGALAGGGAGRWQAQPLAGVSARRAAAILALYARDGGDEGAPSLAYAGPGVAESHALAPGIIAGWVPLRSEGATLAAIEGSLDAGIGLAARHPGFAQDLIARDPGLAPLVVPDLGLSESGTPIEGTALCLVAGEGGLKLMADTARVDAATLALFASRIAHLADCDGEAPVEGLDLISAGDRAVLERLNDTAMDYDPALSVVHQFESRAAEVPEATALVFEGQALSYGALNTRANRIAHLLRAMGAGPDIPVALFLRRGPDLIAAALGIMKAGSAYVPMDPAYPAARLAHFLTDSAAPVIVTESALVTDLPAHSAALLVVDSDLRLDGAVASNPDEKPRPSDLAYVIYTSGSTGLPKGVMVEHRNLANFMAAMDRHVPHDPPGVWLAVTSLSFDISVLELFWTLARGFKVVLTSDEDRLTLSGAAPVISDRKMDFSLFYWGNDDGPGPRKYELLLEGARFADSHGFSAVWLPERHFHAFGGPYPNPSVLGAAVAAVTRNIAVRAGSVVAPLHHPVRIAEEWAVIDNLTNGRAGLGIASGWHPVDFILRPENAPPNNKKAMFETIDMLRRLWRGEAVEFDRGGERVPVQSLPRPVSAELPIWLTIAGNPETWREAGQIGAHVLTHLLGQSIDEVAEKIGIYHAALREAGHDPADFRVVLMLHTYVARTRELARETARGPMRDYLLSAAGLVKQYAWSFPAFKRPAGATSPMDLDLRSLSKDEVDGVLEYAFNRYFEDSGLFGTVEDCLNRVEQLKAIGVTEVASLIDYGIAPEQVLEGLYPLTEVLRRSNRPGGLAEGDYSLAAQIRRHGVTHLQCTPSMARLFLADAGARDALATVPHLLIGGEALPGGLARALAGPGGRRIRNLYGPTETTIWSTTGMAAGNETTVPIGAPVGNTRLHVLGSRGRAAPVGVAGELCIGGDGVARGYLNRPELNSERFVAAPGGAGRMYRTGDLVRLLPDGRLDFLGRTDHQVKLRGYRIEPGEVEAVLEALPGIDQAVVQVREDRPGDQRLVAYVVGPGAGDTARLKAAARDALPPHMRPGAHVALDRLPLTPNKKIDRGALPAPESLASAAPAVPTTSPGAADTLARLAEIWRAVLGAERVEPGDSFFALGGHSLLAVHLHREIREKLALPGFSVTDVFRFPVLADLARHIDTRLRPIPMEGSEGAGEMAAQEPAGAEARLSSMSRRRALRSGRQERAG